MIEHLSTLPTSPRRVVVFGASGFVGSELVERLRSGGIATLAPTSSELDLCSPHAERTLAALLREGDAVVFSAALTPEKGSDVQTVIRNLKMVEALGNLERCPCTHLVYISSDAIYDDSDSLVRESTRPAPQTLYGHMHLLREKVLATAASRWDCPFVVIRPCALYGFHDTHNSYGPNRFCRTASRQQRIALFGHGEELRDHVSVRDLVRLLELVLRHRSRGLLNAATGCSVSFQAVANMIAGMVDQPITVEYLARRMPVSHRHFDITALIRAFPSFRFGDLSVGLRQFLDASVMTRAA